MNLKTCSKCKQQKLIFDFFRNVQSRDGHRNDCKVCQKHVALAWQQANKERRKLYQKEYRKRPQVKKRRAELSKLWNRENIESVLLTKAKKRARLLRLDCNLSKEDIVVPSCCPILGIPLKITAHIIGDNSPTLDRIIPHLGYIRGNVAVISARANRIKNDATVEEIERVFQWLKTRIK